MIHEPKAVWIVLWNGAVWLAGIAQRLSWSFTYVLVTELMLL